MDRHFISLLFLLPLALCAQVPRDLASLKYWPAPLYWQPTQAENRMGAKSELFSAASPQAFPPTAAPATALVFVAMTPCRLVDTRVGFGFTGAFGPPSLVGGATRSFPMQMSTMCSIPSNAQAYSLNITVAPPGQMYYLTIWPFGASQPNASTLNDLLGTVIANAAIVPAGNDVGSGSVSVFVSNNTDLIIDINGYYISPTDMSLNTAIGWGALANSTGGVENTAVGSQALQNNTVGLENTANGFEALLNNTTGSYNTASGDYALVQNTTGSYNTASGNSALEDNIIGQYNTATGYQALQNNNGSQNTANGFDALQNNTGGSQNTASGFKALQNNTNGGGNTASGWEALGNNTIGNGNTASGVGALVQNTTGSNNTASGASALESNTIGGGNTAAGVNALQLNTTGTSNTAGGTDALESNTTGTNNTSSGFQALEFNTTGNNNIAIGYEAAYSVSGGNSNNIHVGSQGASGDSGTIRLGAPGTQTSLFVAGVRGVTTGSSNAVPVVIDANGQLGTISSSARFKEDIQDMANASAGLLRLRPVTYRYKLPYADGSKPLDYGLIAEEVAEVYPDLVVKNADGQVETVQYQKLTPMLLNELQKQAALAAQQREKLSLQEERINTQQELIQKLEDRLAALEAAAAGAK